jgi:hypothetical protein
MTSIFTVAIREEHYRAELQRLSEGWAGCGCSFCQELYKSIDLSKYGNRVKQHGDAVFILETPWLQPQKDRWTGDIRTIGGLRFIVSRSGKTVCKGNTDPVTMADVGELKLIRVIPNPAEECPSYEGCGASLCPMDDRTLKNCQWYPDDPVCTRRGSAVPSWVKTQRKVAKKAKSPDLYFTVNDLVAMKRVIRPTGHDPDVLLGKSVNKTANSVPTRKNERSTTIDDRGKQGRLSL